MGDVGPAVELWRYRDVVEPAPSLALVANIIAKFHVHIAAARIVPHIVLTATEFLLYYLNIKANKRTQRNDAVFTVR